MSYFQKYLNGFLNRLVGQYIYDGPRQFQTYLIINEFLNH